MSAGLDVAADLPGEFVTYGFVLVAWVGLLQGAELTQRLDLIGADGDPLRLVCGGLPFGGSRGFGGGELGPEGVQRTADQSGVSPARSRPGSGAGSSCLRHRPDCAATARHRNSFVRPCSRR